MVDQQEADRLKTFWNSRYNNFSLLESGIKSLTSDYSKLLYRCKGKAYVKALAKGGIATSTPLRILDGGCGQGFFALLAQDIFERPTYTGVDISDKAISFLERLYPRFSWKCADLCDNNFKLEEEFDVAQSIEVLHLILDDRNHRQAISNLSSNLVPDGILIITDILPLRPTQINDYIIFRPMDYYDALFNQMGLRLLDVFPMYYWIPDMGMTLPKLRRFFNVLPPELIYYFDRLLSKLRVPQIAQSHDSKMKMMVCRRTS